MTLYGLFIPADPTVPASMRAFDDKDTGTLLSALQAAVGGFLEPLSIEDTTFFFDEEGMYKPVARNGRATKFLSVKGVDLMLHGDYLKGDVVVVAHSAGGETLSVKDDDLALYGEHIGEIDRTATA